MNTHRIKATSKKFIKTKVDKEKLDILLHQEYGHKANLIQVKFIVINNST
jgi:hypothetical protein